MKLRIWIALLIIAALLAAAGIYWYTQKGNVDLDNAGEDRLEVFLAGQQYVVEGGESLDIKLESGYHKIIVKDLKNETLHDTLFEVKEGGLINLAGGEYLIWKDVFSPRSTLEERQALLTTRPVVAGKQIYDIEYDSLPPNQLYVEQFWDFRLGEDFPTKVYGYQLEKGAKYMFKTKLLRRQDLATTYLRMSKME